MKKIGITTYIDVCNKRDKNMISVDYIRAIEKAGAIPIIIPLTVNKDNLDQYIDLVDGLVFTGGVDINPNLYNEKNEGYSKKVSVARDDTEMYLLNRATDVKMPVLGICRGLQLINVYYGGMLYQDIMTQFDTIIDHINMEDKGNELHHSVEIEKGSRIFDIYKKHFILVNSRHHQAVKSIGEGLKVTAKSEDGLVEAVEHSEDNVLAVQWHPENLIDNHDNHLQIFKYFVDNMVSK